MPVYWIDQVRENKPNRIQKPKKREEKKLEDREPTKAELLEGQGLR